MGAYLSEPVTKKLSQDEANEYLVCGSSSMQGWRVSQEDAHNCELSFDKDTSLFAVYDGHGGAEVALFCAEKLPAFLKSSAGYIAGNNMEQALKDAFIAFDRTLLEERVIAELKVLAGDKNPPTGGCASGSDEDDDDEEDLAALRNESVMPLGEVLEKYKENANAAPLTAVQKLKKESGAGSSKPLSPFLRARQGNSSLDEGASSSGSGASASKQVAASSSSGSSQSRKLDAKLADEDQVSSSSSKTCPTTTAKNAEVPSSTSKVSPNIVPPKITSQPTPSGDNEASGTCTSNGPSTVAEMPTELNAATTSAPALPKDLCNSPDSSSAKTLNGSAASVTAEAAVTSPENEVVSTNTNTITVKPTVVDSMISSSDCAESSTKENGSTSTSTTSSSTVVAVVAAAAAASAVAAATTTDDVVVARKTTPIEKLQNCISSTNDRRAKRIADLLNKNDAALENEESSDDEADVSFKVPADCSSSDTDYDLLCEDEDDEDGVSEDLDENELEEGEVCTTKKTPWACEDSDDEDGVMETESDDTEELNRYNDYVEDIEERYDYESDEEEEEEEEAEDFDDPNEDQFENDFMNSMIEEPGKDSGCTAVVALLHGKDLYVANAGDSRCVVCRDGEAIEMSFDHKPEDEEEHSRITKAGGKVTHDGRVNGGLNLSRAIGDHAYKMNHELQPHEQMISAMPDINKITIEPNDEFMVLACDGIWNFMPSKAVVDFVRERLSRGYPRVSQICEELFDNCLASNTFGDGTGCDNMTAVIVQFKPSFTKNAETVSATASVTSKRSASSESTGEESTKRAKTDKA